MQYVTYWYQFFTRCEKLVPIFHSVKFGKCEICGSTQHIDTYFPILTALAALFLWLYLVAFEAPITRLLRLCSIVQFDVLQKV